MLLRLRERIEVCLAAEAVTLRRFSRGVRSREMICHRYEVAGSAGAQNWRAAVALLTERFAALAWNNCDVDVVLSSQFARFVVLPWTAGMSESDMLAYAVHAFRSTYGAVADSWAISLGTARPQVPRVAAATERVLIDNLHALASARRLRLRSVKPLLAAIVDAAPKVDQGFDGWIALVEGSYVHVVRFDGGYCSDVRRAQFAGEPDSILLSLLKQSALALDRESEQAPVRLYADRPLECAALRENGWRVSIAEVQFA